jgi:hypothetical protein
MMVAKVRERLAVNNTGHTDFIWRGSISRSLNEVEDKVSH